MVPLCDLVPARTRPVATTVLALAIGATSLVLWTGGAGSPSSWVGGVGSGTALPRAAIALLASPGPSALVGCLLVLWLCGPTVEDRLGSARFLLLWGAAALAAEMMPVTTGWPGSRLLGVLAATTAVAAGNVALYPRGRLLAVTPVMIGFEFVDLPTWLYAVLWVSAVPLLTPAGLFAALAAVLAGAIVGAAGARLLKQPPRMRVAWWDTLEPAARRTRRDPV